MRYVALALSLALCLPSGAAIAQTTLPNFAYREGRVTAKAEINPIASRVLSRSLKKEIPSALEFSATDLEGSFILPPGYAKLASGKITVNAAPLKAFLRPAINLALQRLAQTYDLPDGITMETLETLLNYEIRGTGSIGGDRTTQFSFSYSDNTDVITIEGLDPLVLASCQVRQCQTQTDGKLELNLDIAGLLSTSDRLGLKLPTSVTRILRNARLLGLKELEFAQGTIASGLETQPKALALWPKRLQPPVLTQGDFVMNAERLSAPWSLVFSVP